MKINFSKTMIPWMMAGGRALLGPVMVIGQRCGWNGLTLAGIVVVALLSDIYDGVLARRWRCDTAGVRLFDSLADIAFYFGTAVAFYLGWPISVHKHATLLRLLLGLEAAQILFALVKFGKPPSYHSYLAKTWGLVLASALVGIFAFGHPGVLLPLALWLGVASNLEGFTMSLVLPTWQRDVKTLAAAWRLRGELLGALCTLPVKAVAVLAMVVAFSATSFAAEPMHSTYTGGTSSVHGNSRGSLDTSSPSVLVFHAQGTAEIDIPYASIRSIRESNQRAYQLGFLPMIAVGLIIHPIQRHFYTITYADSSQTEQVVIFEVPGSATHVLCAVLETRAPASRTACTGSPR
jgi:phosphatidylglycerophosphate synthase